MRWNVGIPLLVKTLALAVLAGVGTWLVLDYWQGRAFRAFFLQHQAGQLEIRAREDRQFFDRHAQGHSHAAKIIISQQRFLRYLDQAQWDEPAREVLERHRPPPWMPETSVMRVFFNARHALLFDHEGGLREIYFYFPDPLPEGLRQRGTLLQKLSHSQTYLTSIDGQPYVIAGQTVTDDQGAPRATLMLTSPIDETFLADSQGLFRTENVVVALLEKESDRVLASSDESLIPSDTRASAYQQDFLMTGESFFDYGSSDLEVRFASFISTQPTNDLATQLLARVSTQRAWLTAALISVFLLLVSWLTWRIRVLHDEIADFAWRRLGLKNRRAGDEITRIQGITRQLINGLNQGIEQVKAVASGNYNQEVALLSHQDQLGLALRDMTGFLRQARKRNELQNWHKSGQNQLNEKLAGEMACPELARKTMELLTPYLDARRGMFYLLEHGPVPWLQLLASVDYQERIQLANRLELGDGPAGQAARERNTILLTNPEEDPPHPGLERRDGALLAMPFLYKTQVKGVLEFEFEQAPPAETMDFLRAATQTLGVVVHTTQSREAMQRLVARHPAES